MMLSLAVISGPLASTVLAQDAGTLAGRSTTSGPNFEVRIQDTATNQFVERSTLDQNGQFSISGLALPGRFLVVLYDTTRNRVVCTEGPYGLTPGSAATAGKTDIVISCGRPPAALLLGTLAGAGAAAAVLAVTLQSGSR